MTNNEDKRINWEYCPGCGNKLPDVEKLRFCVKCGLDLFYIKEHKRLPPSQVAQHYIPATQYPSYPVSYAPYKRREIIADEEILNVGDKKLWSTLMSILLPLIAFVIMNGLIIGIFLQLGFLGISSAIIYNPIFLVLTTLVELILIILPIFYIGKYLQNPSLKNRLSLLGFTAKGFDRRGVLKEILIGISFAVIGIFLVAFSSFAIELILEFIFGIEIISNGAESDAEAMITGMDIIVLILIIIMMLAIVGPSEEILFRGFMMKGLVRTLGKKMGLILTAFIFALYHLVLYVIYLLLGIISLFYFVIIFTLLIVPYFAISLMIGLLYSWRKENLIAVIVTHGVYNSLTVVIAYIFSFF